MLLIILEPDLSRHPEISEQALGRLKVLADSCAETWYRSDAQTRFQVKTEGRQLILTIDQQGHCAHGLTKYYFTEHKLGMVEASTAGNNTSYPTRDPEALSNYIPHLTKILTEPYHLDR